MEELYELIKNNKGLFKRILELIEADEPRQKVKANHTPQSDNKIKEIQGLILQLVENYCNTLYKSEQKPSAKARELVMSHMQECVGVNRLDQVPEDELPKLAGFLRLKMDERE